MVVTKLASSLSLGAIQLTLLVALLQDDNSPAMPNSQNRFKGFAAVHPVDFLLDMLADTNLTMKERRAAAQSLLPYVATRLATTEVNVSGSLSDESEASLLNRLVSGQGQLVQLGLSVIEAEPVNE